MPNKLAVLVSGTGSLLEAISDAGVPVSLVVADRPCRGLDVAAARGLPTELVCRRSFETDFDRAAYTRDLLAILQAHKIDLVAMAGFMTILDEVIFTAYPREIINTHPSLLPAFRGSHAVRDALADNASETGCTIHIATAQLDAGPIIKQERVPIYPDDTEDTLHERIKTMERVLYPAVLKKLLKS